MGYGKKIYDQAREELDHRRLTAEEAARENRERLYLRCPRLREIREELAANASGAARAVFSGGNARNELEKLRERAASLNEESDRLLAENGASRSDLEPRYVCEKCRDTGFADGKMCDCLRQLQRSLAYESLSMDAPLEKSTFDSFSLEYYRNDPEAFHQMKSVLNTCREYAKRFRSASPSFLFWGGTGLGKTHLSLAIAGAAIEKGYGVIYGSVQSFAVSLERERFSRQAWENSEDTQSRLTDCDLLILDDLGTEFPSGYVSAALYDVLNSRMLAGKPTIISTNLSVSELEERYGQRFASRICGYYGILAFLGNDIRLQKQKDRQKGKKQPE